MLKCWSYSINSRNTAMWGTYNLELACQCLFSSGKRTKDRHPEDSPNKMHSLHLSSRCDVRAIICSDPRPGNECYVYKYQIPRVHSKQSGQCYGILNTNWKPQEGDDIGQPPAFRRLSVAVLPSERRSDIKPT